MICKARGLVAIALILVSLAGCGLFITPERRIERAEAYMADGDYGSAAIELRQALDAEPESAKGRLLLAQVTYQVGELQDAEKELRRAIDLQAEPAQTAALAAEIELALGQFQKVAARMAQAVPGLSEAQRLTYLGYAQSGLGQAGDALGSFGAVTAANPTPGEALRARTGTAEALARAGQIDEALAQLEAVLAEDPDYALASLWKGVLLAQRGQAAEAEKVLASLVLQSQRSQLTVLQRITGFAALVETQFAQSNLDGVEQTLKQMQGIGSRALVYTYLTARLALARNDTSTAVTELQKVVRAAPQLTNARLMLAQALAASGSLAQAETELQTIVQSDPDNIEARKLLADTQIRAGRPDAAVDSLFPAVKANTTDPQVYSLFGRAKFNEGDRESAALFWERSLESAPDDSRLKMSLAAEYIGAGQSQKALELLATIPDAEGGKQKRQLQLIAMATGKDPARANEEIVALVKRTPEDVELLNLAAAWHTSRGEFDPARKYLDSALQQQPENVPVLLGLARLQVAAKDPGGATATLERVLKIKPDNGAALMGLSQIAAQQGDAAAAKRWLEEWRKRDPKSAEARLLLARQALQNRDTKAGDALIDEALAASPKQASVANAAGQVLLEAGRYDEALRRFREAIELAPQTPQLHYNAARAQLALSQREAARESLVKVLALQPDWVPAVVLLAQLDLKTGRQDAALAAAEKLKKSAEPARGYLLEADVQASKRDFAAADQALAEAQRLEPSAQIAVARYNVRRQGKLPQPQQPLLDWLAKSPQDAAARFALAEWKQAQGDLPGAIKEYEALDAQVPGKPVIQNNLAWLYAETGDPRAEALAAKAHAGLPGDWAVADTYGWILVSKGKVDEGLKILEQAYEKSNNNHEVAYHLGVAQAKAGKTDAARATLTKALTASGSPAWHDDARRALDGLK